MLNVLLFLHRILLYRDGISDGELEEICRKEVATIQEALEEQHGDASIPLSMFYVHVTSKYFLLQVLTF